MYERKYSCVHTSFFRTEKRTVKQLGRNGDRN